MAPSQKSAHTDPRKLDNPETATRHLCTSDRTVGAYPVPSTCGKSTLRVCAHHTGSICFSELARRGAGGTAAGRTAAERARGPRSAVQPTHGEGASVGGRGDDAVGGKGVGLMPGCGSGKLVGSGGGSGWNALVTAHSQFLKRGSTPGLLGRGPFGLSLST